jgi:endoglucanase
MTARLARACSVLLVLVAVAGGEARAATRFVRVDGTRLVAPDGRALVLKGINIGHWLQPEGYMFGFESRAASARLIGDTFAELVGEEEAARFWRAFRERYVTRDDIRFIKRAGFDSVRVPFDYRLLVTPDEARELEGPGYGLLDSVVGWCRDEGLYVVLDMHSAPGGQTGDNIDNSYGYPFLFESEESQLLTVRIWEELARRYADEPAVLGYDLLNEPIPHFFDTAALNPKLEPVYKRIVAGVRKYDKNHVIFLGGAQWDSNFKVFGPPFDPQLVYTFHKYWTEPDRSVIQEYLDFRDRYRVPIWLGESGENTDEWIAAFRRTLESEQVGWCFWPFKRLDATRCVVSVAKPKDWDAVVAYANAPRTSFEEVRKARPPVEVARRALAEYLDNVALARCRTNDGYLRALGLATPAAR